MSKVVYLAHYDLPNGKRNTSPAGTTVINYMINSLEKLKKNAIVISPALSKEELPREEIKISEHIKTVLLQTFKLSNKYNILVRYLRRFRQRTVLEKELFRQIEDGDTLIVYHSLSLIDTVKKIAKKRKINFILQICEIYGDVINDKRKKNKELRFFKKADRYIFQSELIEKLVNTEGKPFSILHGSYELPVTCSRSSDLRNESKKIRCVYAGTLDPRKGGALVALNVVPYLPENYHMYILGFGTEREIEDVKARIEKLSATSMCSVSFEGCLTGNEYINFISSCDIGLSTQDPMAAFNDTSFPSKILVYMANGLRVVTVRIPVIEASAISKDVYYYAENTPECIAQAITEIDFNDKCDGKETVRELDCAFLEKLEKLL